jgi:hypothetical protein
MEKGLKDNRSYYRCEIPGIGMAKQVKRDTVKKLNAKKDKERNQSPY